MIRFTSGGAAKLKKKLKYIIIVLLLLIGVITAHKVRTKKKGKAK